MNNFNRDLSKAIRYSMETAENLLTQLASPDHVHTRAGTPKGDRTFRGVVADALQDQGRDAEADLLRGAGHVVVHDGKVKKGRLVAQGVVDRLRQLATEHNNTYHDPHWFNHTIEPAEGGFRVTSHRPYGNPPDVSVYPPDQLNDRLAEYLRRELGRQADTNTMMHEGIGEAGEVIESLLRSPLEEPVPETEDQ